MLENEYNLYYDDEFVGTYTTTELAKKIGVSIKKISYYANEKITYKKHYTFHKIYRNPTVHRNNVNKFGEDLLDEWDRITQPYRMRAKAL